MKLEPRISMITLGVKNMKKARVFYEALGWKASSVSDEEITFFGLNSIVIGLYPLKHLLKDEKLEGTTPVPGAISLGYYTRTRSEIDEVLAMVSDAGGKVISPPFKAPWGWVSYFSDLDGHIWEVSWIEVVPMSIEGNLVLPE